ncbi:MAG: dCTP deaminase [Elusimicrobia bacterium]|nr:dCTP deaminase [Candidatus Liberimonas magnetica]
MIKPDKWIVKMAREHKMIEPFEEAQVRKGVISYGVSSYGYDMRVANEFKIYQHKGVLDPKRLEPSCFKEVKADDFIVIEPNSYILGRSLEYFRIPRNILTICFGKSTYARCGVIVNVTPFEPEWEGYVTMSISNTSNVPVKLYVNEGIAQVIFLEANEICQTSYADKKGKYQAQDKITVAKL